MLPNKNYVHVVAKCIDDNVKGVNKFMQDQVNAKKFFVKNEGWLPWKT